MERDIDCFLLYVLYSDFNSHAHVERDSMRSPPILPVRHFNSHAHVERDRYVADDEKRLQENFNSHAHVERDGFGYE